MVTKGRYQTVKNENISKLPFSRFSVTDTNGKTLGRRFVCCTDTEDKADHVAHALNFNNRPSEYGYRLVD